MGLFKQKATQAILKNFVQVKKSACRVKTKAISLCNELQLSRLAKGISECKKGSLDVFFTVKTHKPGMPFRSIVSERDSWQQKLSKFLLKHLKGLEVDDPFATRNSADVTAFLKDQSSIGYLFSVDVEDLFYSVPHSDLFKSVRECIESNGVITFQNSAGLSVDNFLSLLEFYLRSTFVSFDTEMYLQKKGICIGSCVAPALCNIFLSSIDRALASSLDNDLVLRIFRYVDDYLVILKRTNTALTLPSKVESILSVFRQQGKGWHLLMNYQLRTACNF